MRNAVRLLHARLGKPHLFSLALLFYLFLVRVQSYDSLVMLSCQFPTPTLGPVEGYLPRHLLHFTVSISFLRSHKRRENSSDISLSFKHPPNCWNVNETKVRDSGCHLKVIKVRYPHYLAQISWVVV